MSKIKDYYWEMLEYFDKHPEEDSMNFDEQEREDLMKQFEEMLDHLPQPEMSDEDLEEMAKEMREEALKDWGRDADLSMSNGLYGDEDLGVEYTREYKSYDEYFLPSSIGRVVNTKYGKGVLIGMVADDLHGTVWSIKLDYPLDLDWQHTDKFRTHHPEDFEFINENIPPVIPGGHDGGPKCCCGVSAVYGVNANSRMHDSYCPLSLHYNKGNA